MLIFHGYLLRGTGSNVYNARLAAALVAAGHEVHLLCQERAPFDVAAVDAAADWDHGGELRVRARRDPARLTVYRPDIGGLLPVYVADEYEGVRARPFPELSDAELEAYVARNVAAVAEVAGRVRPDLALANHVVMGPAILRRSLGPRGVPYAVKVHGSALEYTVKPHPERFGPWAREGLAGARAVLVGSVHTARSLWAALDLPDLPARTRLGPPGVDVEGFAPRDPAQAAAGLDALRARLRERTRGAGAAAAPEEAGVQAGAGARGPEAAEAAAASSSFARDPGAAAALDQVRLGEDRLVAFVGKLLLAKGVDLLLAAWPLVLDAEPRARLVVVGFGAFRAGAERLVADLGRGDLDAVWALAAAGPAVEGGEARRLESLAAFLDALRADPPALARYRAAAAALPARVAFTGPLEHADLVDLLPACEALAVPSTFPEAFGMVAAEAAACGVPPVCAAHSGLAEVAAGLAGALPPDARLWLTFPLGPSAVPALAERLVATLRAPAGLRAEARRALAARAHERHGWDRVAAGVVAAAQGRLDELPAP